MAERNNCYRSKNTCKYFLKLLLKHSPNSIQPREGKKIKERPQKPANTNQTGTEKVKKIKSYITEMLGRDKRRHINNEKLCLKKKKKSFHTMYKSEYIK